MKLFIHDKRAINQGISLCAENDGKKFYTESAVYYAIKKQLGKEFPNHKVMKKSNNKYPIGLTSIPYYLELKNKTDHFIFYDNDYAIRSLTEINNRSIYLTYFDIKNN